MNELMKVMAIVGTLAGLQLSDIGGAVDLFKSAAVSIQGDPVRYVDESGEVRPTEDIRRDMLADPVRGLFIEIHKAMSREPVELSPEVIALASEEV